MDGYLESPTFSLCYKTLMKNVKRDLPGNAWEGASVHVSVVIVILSNSMVGVPFTAPRPSNMI